MVIDPIAITIDNLAAVIAENPLILVIGCGERFLPPPKGLRDDLRKAGIALEWMDTGAACRTFNVLLAEDRGAVAALIAVD
jgi:uncharacterized protein